MEDSLKVIRFALDKWYPLYGELNLDIAYANVILHCLSR